MKEEDLNQLKSEFADFFKQIEELVIANNRFKEIIDDYIECRNRIDELIDKKDKSSQKLLSQYVSIQKELEVEINSQLRTK